MNKSKLVGQGRTAEVFALGDERVLKLFRPDMTAKSVQKEYNLGKILAEAGAPAPAVYEFVCQEGRNGIVYQYIPGKTLLEHISNRPYAVLDEARRLARIHVKIHKHTVAGLPNQKEILAENILNARPLSIEQHATADRGIPGRL